MGMRRLGLSEEIPQLEDWLARFRLEPAKRRELPLDIQRVLSYIEENAFDPKLNVQRIKSHCCLRDNNISSRFRLCVGITIRDYLEARRMEAATFLLQKSQATIMEIAFAVGYNNLQTFYAAFHRKHSCTPDTYRRNGARSHLEG